MKSSGPMTPHANSSLVATDCSPTPCAAVFMCFYPFAVRSMSLFLTLNRDLLRPGLLLFACAMPQPTALAPLQLSGA